MGSLTVKRAKWSLQLRKRTRGVKADGVDLAFFVQKVITLLSLS